jgi:hypothetical protein
MVAAKLRAAKSSIPIFRKGETLSLKFGKKCDLRHIFWGLARENYVLLQDRRTFIDGILRRPGIMWRKYDSGQRKPRRGGIGAA